MITIFLRQRMMDDLPGREIKTCPFHLIQGEDRDVRPRDALGV